MLLTQISAFLVLSDLPQYETLDPIPQDLPLARSQYAPTRTREQAHATFHAGALRLDMLQGARIFMGLVEDTRDHGWIVLLGNIRN